MTEEVIERLHSVAATSNDETCGVFSGSVTTKGICRINNISPILVTLESSRYVCVRDAEKANKFIKEEFERSNGSRVYFGEWNTHPESFPSPSSADRKAICSISKEAKNPLELLFFAIAGWKDIYWGCFDGKSFVRVIPTIV